MVPYYVTLVNVKRLILSILIELIFFFNFVHAYRIHMVPYYIYVVNYISCTQPRKKGHTVVLLVEPEGRWFVFRWRRWNFSLTFLLAALWPWS